MKRMRGGGVCRACVRVSERARDGPPRRPPPCAVTAALRPVTGAGSAGEARSAREAENVPEAELEPGAADRLSDVGRPPRAGSGSFSVVQEAGELGSSDRRGAWLGTPEVHWELRRVGLHAPCATRSTRVSEKLRKCIPL
ncbi:hypothetical protein SKAU_G00184940 [Synaphobranchus kaupii]|uniref:Uncharacterized protein n=1 Tax=Synaphobranchus kaupii TaxID=118154 RepID=A0A9Q1FCT8_SYNKA|nr:hypothetical protein SKAU_G00184940 [Synaphobranchus kaupii]